MPRVAFEHMTPVFEQAKTFHALHGTTRDWHMWGLLVVNIEKKENLAVANIHTYL
jgi:hypothetical protein